VRGRRLDSDHDPGFHLISGRYRYSSTVRTVQLHTVQYLPLAAQQKLLLVSVTGWAVIGVWGETEGVALFSIGITLVSRFHAGKGRERNSEDGCLSVNGSLSTCVALSGNV
jgi:hypothetical protein